MQRFFYIARNKEGNKVSGIEDAANQEEAIRKLQSKNFIIINIITEQREAGAAEVKKDAPKLNNRAMHGRIRSDDLVLFCRQLATLLGAGVTILRSLQIISLQVSSRRLFQVVEDLQKKMEGGLSLHEAMAKHSVVFSDLWVHLVESGEASGNLAMVLGRLAGYLERTASFKKKITSALIYPIMLLSASVLALVFLSTKILPTFMELFKGFNIKLPLLTLMLMVVSNFLKRYILLIIFGSVVGFYFIKQYIQTKPGRKQYEKLLFNLPLFGQFFRTLIFERFTSEMATLVESGVPILYSLEITEQSVGNLTVGEIVRDIKEDVRIGKPLSLPLEKSGFFDPMCVQMVAIGEEIGELSNMFKKLSGFYQEYLDTFVERFASLFEPIMLLFLGVVIGTMVIGMFLPIFQIAKIQ